MIRTVPPEEKIKAASRNWFAKTVLETPSPQTQAEFEAWRASDPAHATAYARYLSIWQDSSRLTDLAHLIAPPKVSPPGPVARMREFLPLSWWVPLAAIPLVAVTIICWRSFFEGTEYLSTGTAQVREFTLSDGSHVVLAARSDLAVSYRRRVRALTLNAGEAFFEVTHDTARPFVVEVGNQQVRAVGTSFDIHRASDDLRVSVLNGVVQVGSRGDTPRAGDVRLVRAGEEVVGKMDSGVVGPAHPLSTADPTGWRRGRLEYVDAPLSEIIADANRYSQRRYVITGDALAKETISVSYETSKVDQMVARLPQALPLKVVSHADHVVQLEPVGLDVPQGR